MPRGDGARPRFAILRTEDGKNRTDAQIDGAVGNTIGVNQQRERDSGVLTKNARVVHVAEAYGSNAGPFELKSLFPPPQLHDMPTPKPPTVIPQQPNHPPTP